MKRVGDILSVLFDEEFSRKAGSYSALFSCRKDLTEKNGIAAAGDHSRIVSMERGLVRIEVDHPGWKMILQTKESKLLNDFCRRFPEMKISGLAIFLGIGNVPDQAQREAVLIEKERQDKIPIIDDEINSIKDEALRESLKRLGKIIAAKELNK